MYWLYFIQYKEKVVVDRFILRAKVNFCVIFALAFLLPFWQIIWILKD